MTQYFGDTAAKADTINEVTPNAGVTVDGVLLKDSEVTVADEVYGSGWNGSLEVPTKNAVYDKIESLSVLAAGTYTPTLTNVANLDGSTAYECQYLRVGATVTVSGRVDVDPTTTTATTQLGISLPVASNFGNNQDCAGVAFAPGIAGMGAAIIGDATNDRAQMEWKATDVTNQGMWFTFSYQVI